MADPRLGDLTRSDLLDAIDKFDRDERRRDEWIGWEEKGHYRYALEHDGRWYPVKQIIHIASGVPKDQYSGGTVANGIVEQHGFAVKDLPDPDRDPLAANLRSVLARYPFAAHEGSFGSSHPIWKRFEEIEDLLSESGSLTTRPQIDLQWSVGKGNWARIPWVALLDSRATDSPHGGVYCVYLFREDMSAVCLAVMQGVTETVDDLGRRKGRERLSERANELRGIFEELTDLDFEFGRLDLRTDSPSGRDYEVAAVAHKCYPATELPTDGQLLSDLDATLALYQDFVDRDMTISNMDSDALAQLKETFLRRLPGFESFRMEEGLYWNWERGYKEELRESFQETVLPRVEDRPTGPGGADALRKVVYDLLTRRLEMAGGEPQNLMNWRYYTFLRELDGKETEQFAGSFVDLLRGDGSSAERVERFNEEMLPVLARHDAGSDAVSRSFPTLFLMLDDPQHEIFIRTSLFNRLARRLTGESLFENRLLGREGYERTLEFAGALRGELEAWSWDPRDMIDVQSFMWVGGMKDSDKSAYVHWIFQCNPDHFDLEGYARSRDRISLLVNQHADDIELGDRVYLWESGEDAGILGRAWVIDGPKELPADKAAVEFDRDKPDWFRGEQTRARLYVEEVLDERVSRDRLRQDSGLEDLSILKNAQGSNFRVSEEEAKVLDAYIDGEDPPTRTYLKIAPGRKGKYWEDCRREEVILVGWDELEDLRDYASIDELRKAVTRLYGDEEEGLTSTLSRTANGLWKLRNLRPGDKIVANRGTSEVLGVGTVRRPGYAWNPERENYQHTVSVGWDTSLAGDVSDRGGAWAYTIVELEADEYEDLLEELSGDAGFAGLLEDLESKGFHFPPESVANYLLALQTKRFVILTGISGTGKTRLAIETAKHFRPLVESERVVESPDEGGEIEVYPYMLKYGQMVVPVALSSRVRVFDGSDERSVEIEVQYPEGTTRLTLSREPDRNVTYLNFRGDFRTWFTETFEEGDKLFLDIEATDEGQGQRFILRRAETRREKTRLDNYRVVDVHPDWTDNRGLLGYYNPITDRYRSTPFLELLTRAAREEERAEAEGRQPHPFFVILDEMNLARVEHYFSDFLSALESEESIHLHDDSALEAGNVEEGRPIPQEFEIPDNVFFTGTVNVDETTYMFSPKVLDRALTIELNRVDLRGYGESSSFASAPDSLVIDDLDTPLICERRPNSEDWSRFGDLLEGDLQQLVILLNELLTEDNLHFGYRVANEIARFVLLATSQADGRENAAWAALDLAIMEKVLPKFHGTEQELGSVLRKLFAFAVEPTELSGTDQEELLAIEWGAQNGRLQAAHGREAEAPDPGLPRTGAKLWRMRRRLHDQGFTSFIE